MPSLYERVPISIGQTFREEPRKENVYPAIQTTAFTYAKSYPERFNSIGRQLDKI
jgi:hypothetical protein